MILFSVRSTDTMNAVEIFYMPMSLHQNPEADYVLEVRSESWVYLHNGRTGRFSF
ncbi:hypothetical protein T440DRAFT_473243 [Plenodomus tracheiphilus IPT5]|uniref:Uncharacterized protein n=1 Tax=Plenodomus tracheiphilus IPT5 TaxID=1408161 RepID=A0A6A7AN24_9PLEO|nr:hypothetical protein T440DRAFT_473243 [Plenodomus tracheiphilus IPT5]